LLDDADHHEAAGFADVLSSLMITDRMHPPLFGVYVLIDRPTDHPARTAITHRAQIPPRRFVQPLLSAAACAAMELVGAAAAYGF